MTNTTAHQAAARIREALEQLLNPPHSENVLEAAFQRRDAGRLFNEACSPDSLLALLAERDELAKDAERLREALARVVDADWAYLGREADTGNPDSLYNRVRAGRAALAALTNKD